MRTRTHLLYAPLLTLAMLLLPSTYCSADDGWSLLIPPAEGELTTELPDICYNKEEWKKHKGDVPHCCFELKVSFRKCDQDHHQWPPKCRGNAMNEFRRCIK